MLLIYRIGEVKKLQLYCLKSLILFYNHIFLKKSFSSHSSLTQIKRHSVTFCLCWKSFPRLKFSEYNNFLTDTFFINKIKLLNPHWIAPKTLCIFMFLVLLVSWWNYPTMHQVRVIIYLFSINYIPTKYEFSENMK